MVISIANTDSHWSGKFQIEEVDNFMIKIRQKQSVPRGDLPFILLNVSVKQRHGVTYVVFRPGEDNFVCLYEIDNRTNYDLIVTQKVHSAKVKCAISANEQPENSILIICMMLYRGEEKSPIFSMSPP